MGMLMLVPFRQMQPEAYSHEHCRQRELEGERLAQADGNQGADERGQRLRMTLELGRRHAG